MLSAEGQEIPSLFSADKMSAAPFQPQITNDVGGAPIAIG
jgi:hypothetical protein